MKAEYGFMRLHEISCELTTFLSEYEMVIPWEISERVLNAKRILIESMMMLRKFEITEPPQEDTAA